MKKGFTLIELLAIFVMLGAILLFSAPQITSMLKKGDDEAYESFKKNIYEATEAYVFEEKIIIDNSSSKNIYVKDMLNSGYLKSSLTNPKTNKKLSSMTNAKVLVKKNSDGILSFELLES